MIKSSEIHHSPICENCIHFLDHKRHDKIGFCHKWVETTPKSSSCNAYRINEFLKSGIKATDEFIELTKQNVKPVRQIGLHSAPPQLQLFLNYD